MMVIMKVKASQLCQTFWDLVDYIVHGILQARLLRWVAFPFSGDLPNPGIEPWSSHFKQILYQLSCKGSPRILEWVAYPFCSRSSSPRNQTRISCIAGQFFTNDTVFNVCLQTVYNHIICCLLGAYFFPMLYCYDSSMLLYSCSLICNVIDVPLHGYVYVLSHSVVSDSLWSHGQ